MYKIDNIQIDPQRREINSAGQVIGVEPKVLDLILILLKHRHRVVSKDELIEWLWDNRAISDDALSSCVKSARRVLGDDGRRQNVIRTIHGRGFRFVADVHMENATLPQQDSALGVDLTLPERASVAVLPFQMIGGDHNSEILTKGLTRDIALGLSRIRSLFVTSHASATRFSLEESDPAAIGQALGVRYLVAGYGTCVGNRMRLTVTVSNTEHGDEILAERFDRTMEDLFALQDDIASTVIAVVDSRIQTAEQLRATGRSIESLDAWGAFHAAMALLSRFDANVADECQALLEHAALLEPHSGHICAAQSYLWWQRAFLEFDNDREGNILRAEDLAGKALMLDPLDPFTHWAKGRVDHLRGDFDQAVQSFAAAIDLNPNFALAHYNLAWSRRLLMQTDAGLQSLDWARRLSPYDPMSFAFTALKSTLHFVQGDMESAVFWGRHAVRQPNCHYHCLASQALIFKAAGEDKQAAEVAQRLRRLKPDYTVEAFLNTTMLTENERPFVVDGFRALGLI
ncbi:MAG: winged helix-turn-helix domain-containing protein [Pseudomonadales bacterium]|nr:winged helix-turn-helix domain-containing protein [Pseudomonadales bacterium]